MLFMLFYFHQELGFEYRGQAKKGSQSLITLNRETCFGLFPGYLFNRGMTGSTGEVRGGVDRINKWFLIN